MIDLRADPPHPEGRLALQAFESIMRAVAGSGDRVRRRPLVEPRAWLELPEGTRAGSAARLVAAFLVALCGPDHPLAMEAREVLDERAVLDRLRDLLRAGVSRVNAEIERVAARDPLTAERLGAAAHRLATDDDGEVAEALWTAFCPQAAGIRGEEPARIAALRAARTVTITAPNPDPITDPGREVLFTANVLLTTPVASTDIAALPYAAEARRQLALAISEPQEHWYDHPIQIGVEPAANELLYGLHGLDEALAVEHAAGRLGGRVACVLSVSVTHSRLQRIAREYVAAELRRSRALSHLDLYVVTEGDARRLVDEVLLPATGLPANDDTAMALREVVGVDGPYGRHYSFLKAIAALWHVLVDPAVRATFKIDLDQVFPQDVLLAETGRSAFQHLATPLWGATGVDARGAEVELGMIAGALVNERDIRGGLFTPDVPWPARPLALEEQVFCSRLPQALSTRAEMMERYDGPERDGQHACLERVHVTGGTNGILVDALRQHRPFTPTFIGRAEDQAYILSALGRPGRRLAYLHAAGLIMRHDKEAFAGEAIAAAHVGKVIGDDVRIVQFSTYAEALGDDDGHGDGRGATLEEITALLDPFTGCFISPLPVTVTLLRFALRIADALASGREQLAVDLVENGAPRIEAALLAAAEHDATRRTVQRERSGWAAFHDALDALEDAVATGTDSGNALRARARAVIEGTRVGDRMPRADALDEQK